jgi:hypothetical protein
MQEEVMNKLGYLVLNLSVALYLFANGILGILKQKDFLGNYGGEFGKMIQTIFGKGSITDILVVVLSLCAIAAGIFILLQLFNIRIKINELILIIFVIVWAAFIVIVDIINPLQARNKPDFLPYLVQLSAHLMVLGGLISAAKRAY